MSLPLFVQETENPEWWTADGYKFSDSRPPIGLVVTTDGEKPSADYRQAIVDFMQDVDSKILAASDLILENYSYEHYKNLGVEESLLIPGESAEEMARVATLQSIRFFDEDAESCEMSFSVPWDHHSYDVEFEGGEPVTCSVNG